MYEIFAFQSLVVLVVSTLLLGLKAWAFIDSVTHSAEAYEAAGKLTKTAWMIILGVSLAAAILLWGSSPINLISIVGTVASLVYLVDVRPTIRSLTRN